MLTIAVNKV